MARLVFIPKIMPISELEGSEIPTPTTAQQAGIYINEMFRIDGTNKFYIYYNAGTVANPVYKVEPVGSSGLKDFYDLLIERAENENGLKNYFSKNNYLILADLEAETIALTTVGSLLNGSNVDNTDPDNLEYDLNKLIDYENRFIRADDELLYHSSLTSFPSGKFTTGILEVRPLYDDGVIIHSTQKFTTNEGTIYYRESISISDETATWGNWSSISGNLNYEPLVCNLTLNATLNQGDKTVLNGFYNPLTGLFYSTHSGSSFSNPMTGNQNNLYSDNLGTGLYSYDGTKYHSMTGTASPNKMYYSFGNFFLELPDPSNLMLSTRIGLTQISGEGGVVFNKIGNPETGNPDDDYQNYEVTTPEYKAGYNGAFAYDNSGNKITQNPRVYIFTVVPSDDNGGKEWTLETDNNLGDFLSDLFNRIKSSGIPGIKPSKRVLCNNTDGEISADNTTLNGGYNSVGRIADFIINYNATFCMRQNSQIVIPSIEEGIIDELPTNDDNGAISLKPNDIYGSVQASYFYNPQDGKMYTTYTTATGEYSNAFNSPVSNGIYRDKLTNGLYTYDSTTLKYYPTEVKSEYKTLFNGGYLDINADGKFDYYDALFLDIVFTKLYGVSGRSSINTVNGSTLKSWLTSEFLSSILIDSDITNYLTSVGYDIENAVANLEGFANALTGLNISVAFSTVGKVDFPVTDSLTLFRQLYNAFVVRPVLNNVPTKFDVELSAVNNYGACKITCNYLKRVTYGSFNNASNDLTIDASNFKNSIVATTFEVVTSFEDTEREDGKKIWTSLSA